MLDATLAFDRVVLPTMQHPHFKGDEDNEDLDSFLDFAGSAMRFDCAGLLFGFLVDTGVERYAELRQTGEEVRLPFPSCVFQFADFAIVAAEIPNHFYDCDLTDEIISGLGGEHEQEPDLTVVEVDAYIVPLCDDADVLHKSAEPAFFLEAEAAFVKQEMDGGVYDPIVLFATTAVRTDDEVKLAAYVMLGLLTLFEERLLVTRYRESVPAAVNAKRKRNGITPVAAHRVLTLNLAETRRRTKSVALHHHESPMLHWRRGHWRTLGRGSEFEKRTWIRRCLVGDPDRGFVQKHYRTIWQPTIH